MSETQDWQGDPEPTTDEPWLPEPVARDVDPPEPNSSWSDFDEIRIPLQDAEHRKQQAPLSCAVGTQGAVLESITGRHCDVQELTELAWTNRWYDPARGTRVSDVGKILEVHGVPCEQLPNAEITDIVAALARGDKAMVVLDGTEIAGRRRDAAAGVPAELPNAGHCVWVTGVDMTPDDSIHVVVVDPGHPAGRLDPVQLNDFLNAWDDYGNHLVVARTGSTQHWRRPPDAHRP